LWLDSRIFFFSRWESEKMTCSCGRAEVEKLQDKSGDIVVL